METNSKNLKLQEDFMRMEIANVKDVKEKVQEQIHLLRDDRSVFLRKVDALAGEINGYRQEMEDFKLKLSVAINTRVSHLEHENSKLVLKTDYLHNELETLKFKFQDCIQNELTQSLTSFEEVKI